MNESFKTLIKTIPILLLAATSQAGVSTSGGGFAVVCRNQQSEITSAEVLDLFEAREVYRLTLMASTGDMKTDYYNSAKNTYTLQTDAKEAEEILEYTEQHEYTNLYVSLQNFMDRVLWLSSALELPKAEDLGQTQAHLYMKPGCQIEQIAYMEDNPAKTYIRKEIWDRLDSLNQAALVQHELHYHGDRVYLVVPETSSEHIRRNIAVIFASNFIEGAKHGIPSGEKEIRVQQNLNSNKTGKHDNTTFFKFETGESVNGIPITRMQFTFLGGRAVLTKTYVDLPQRLNYMDVFPLVGFQFPGWYVIALPDEGFGSGIKFHVMDPNGWIMAEILQR